MLGVLLTMWQNFYVLLIGRVVWGLAVGIQSVAMPRYVEEFVPLRLYSLCITTYAVSMNAGTIFALCSAVILPPDTDAVDLIDDQVRWRIIFGIPFVWFALSTLGFLFFVKVDGPTFHLGRGERDEALASYRAIYRCE